MKRQGNVLVAHVSGMLARLAWRAQHRLAGDPKMRAEATVPHIYYFIIISEDAPSKRAHCKDSPSEWRRGLDYSRPSWDCRPTP